MKNFVIECEWTLRGSYTVQAENFDDAVDDISGRELPTNGVYVGNSFRRVYDDEQEDNQ